MSTSTTEPKTIADLGDPKGEVLPPPIESKKKSKLVMERAEALARAEGFFASVLEPSPPSEVESLKEAVRQLKESVEALRDAYNRHHHANFDGSPTSPTSLEV